MAAITGLAAVLYASAVAFSTIKYLGVAYLLFLARVRYSDGTERYLTFSGETEYPEPGEVIFADGTGQAHARRWTNRQSRLSAVQPSTSTVLIVSEALHPTASYDQPRLLEDLMTVIGASWLPAAKVGVLTASSPRFEASMD
jgi:DNA/RNA-binding domain of Phe-tRNA-synthetase-like protein